MIAITFAFILLGMFTFVLQMIYCVYAPTKSGEPYWSPDTDYWSKRQGWI